MVKSAKHIRRVMLVHACLHTVALLTQVHAHLHAVAWFKRVQSMHAHCGVVDASGCQHPLNAHSPADIQNVDVACRPGLYSDG
eukprot:scaffold152227_cov20-Tisochrysis_lutea.AAC.2